VNGATNPYLKMLEGNLSSTGDTSNQTEIIGYVPPLVSGNRLDFNVYILDQDGNVYTSDSKSKASLDSKGADSGSSLSDEEEEDGLGGLPVTATGGPQSSS
jgi:hypothetical protein